MEFSKAHHLFFNATTAHTHHACWWRVNMFDTDALPCVGDLERTSAIKAGQPNVYFDVFVILEPLPKTKDD